MDNEENKDINSKRQKSSVMLTGYERWFTVIAFSVGFLPLLLITASLHLLPPEIPVIDFAQMGEPTEYISKYNNLIAGLFCLVPLFIVVAARYIKNRLTEYKNYSLIMCVSISLSVIFTLVVAYGVTIQINNIQSVENIDFIKLLCVVACLMTAILGNRLRFKSLNSRVAIKNRFTKKSSVIFKKVHSDASAVITISFVVLSIINSLFSGYIALIIYFSAAVLFVIWTYVHSFAIKTKFDKKYLKIMSR